MWCTPRKIKLGTNVRIVFLIGKFTNQIQKTRKISNRIMKHYIEVPL